MDRDAIDTANGEALTRIVEADPMLVDVCPAGEAIEGLGERTVLHAGPPIAWERMCAPMRGAAAGAIVFEGWAGTLEEAQAMAAAGEIAFRPNHEHGALGPMTGITTRSMPVLVVENQRFGNRAHCTLNEGMGMVMRFGGNNEEVRGRLAWMAADAGPALSRALRSGNGIGLKSLVARALSMGDELHMRNAAGTGLFVRAIAPLLARTTDDGTFLARLLRFIGNNDQYFLNVVMAMGKAIMDPASGIAGSTVVTAMCRNGTEFGIRVSGTRDTWFTAPCEMPQGLYFPGYSGRVANPDIGDSTIAETMGLGGFAMASSPAVAGFLGAGTATDALDYTRSMRRITVGENPEWTLPALDFAGTPTGIDIRKVVAERLCPVINTAIAHREAGVGMVGAGIARAPLACFEAALAAFEDQPENGNRA